MNKKLIIFQQIYEEVTDLNQLSDVMESYLKEYNNQSRSPMSLVFFQFAIEHMSRFARVLKQDSGHSLFIGIGGSGRQSLTEMSAFKAGFDLIQVSVLCIYSSYECG
jgi:dynein heavy chain